MDSNQLLNSPITLYKSAEELASGSSVNEDIELAGEDSGSNHSDLSPEQLIPLIFPYLFKYLVNSLCHFRHISALSPPLLFFCFIVEHLFSSFWPFQIAFCVSSVMANKLLAREKPQNPGTYTDVHCI